MGSKTLKITLNCRGIDVDVSVTQDEIVIRSLVGHQDYVFDNGEGNINTLRTGDADLRIYITTVQDG